MSCGRRGVQAIPVGPVSDRRRNDIGLHLGMLDSGERFAEDDYGGTDRTSDGAD